MNILAEWEKKRKRNLAWLILGTLLEAVQHSFSHHFSFLAVREITQSIMKDINLLSSTFFFFVKAGIVSEFSLLRAYRSDCQIPLLGSGPFVSPVWVASTKWLIIIRVALEFGPGGDQGEHASPNQCSFQHSRRWRLRTPTVETSVLFLVLHTCTQFYRGTAWLAEAKWNRNAVLESLVAEREAPSSFIWQFCCLWLGFSLKAESRKSVYGRTTAMLAKMNICWHAIICGLL